MKTLISYRAIKLLLLSFNKYLNPTMQIVLKNQNLTMLVSIYLKISFLKNIRATKTNGPSPQWDNIQEKF